MRIAFDLDDTVLTQGSPSNKYADSEAKPEMVELVNELYDAGHEIYFFTARHFHNHIHTSKLLEEAGFKFHGLYLNKISVDLFVDDRAFRWEDGKQQDLLDLIDSLEK